MRESSHTPHRGTRRDDIRPWLRITNFAVAFVVNDVALRVSVLGVYYGGQDYADGMRFK